ncbi:hypothetical protein AB4Z40_33590 [Bosea sp. 2YAB26]|uniref:hypothetical protein n=1 Tax=unclassified Bosea (in: a-proteobacteria) TaxID=2653178 RepID=UPI003F8FA843
MFTGKGVLVDKAGMRLMVTYQYVAIGECGRAGRLYSEPIEAGPFVFDQTFDLECEDGVAMIVVVTQVSGRRWVFFGREPGKNPPPASSN